MLHFYLDGSEHPQQKPQHDGKTERSRFNQRLQVVVMGSTHLRISRETAELRIDFGKYAQAPSEDWFLTEHFQRIAIDRQSGAPRQFRTSPVVNARQSLS